MKKKLFLYYMILTVVSLCITGFFISNASQRIYRYEAEEKLTGTAELIKQQISAEINQGIKIDYDKKAHDYAKTLSRNQNYQTPAYTDTRITIIDYSGKVLGESENDYSEMENHLNRKEVMDAISGKIGKDVRFSNTVKHNLLYVAVPIEDARIVIRISAPLIQLETIEKTIWLYSLIGIIAGIIAAAFLALRLTNLVTLPVKELIMASREISLGNYSKKVKVNTRDELGQLADTFNFMAEQLKKNVEELTDKNANVNSIINSMMSGIIAVDRNYRIILINEAVCELFNIPSKDSIIGTKIIEHIRNNQINLLLHQSIEKNIPQISEITINLPDEKILRVSTNPIKSEEVSDTNLGGIVVIQDITSIRKLEQIRTDFVSNVTHELKTPLTSIRGFIETLRSGAIADKEVADRFLEIIDIEAERLYILINDILQLSEIENKQKDINIGKHNLNSIITETLSILQGVAEKKNISLTSNVDKELCILANRDRIKQMMINLIENGIKYTLENGSVHVYAARKAGGILISVKDTGIGIPKEHLPRIFERFYRVDKGRSRNMGGTGLGLSIVKHIVNLYNGDIKVLSTPGEGTEFIIRLPNLI